MAFIIHIILHLWGRLLIVPHYRQGLIYLRDQSWLHFNWYPQSTLLPLLPTVQEFFKRTPIIVWWTSWLIPILSDRLWFQIWLSLWVVQFGICHFFRIQSYPESKKKEIWPVMHVIEMRGEDVFTFNLQWRFAH